MRQQYLRLNLCTRRTRKAVFLDETELVRLVTAVEPVKSMGRPPFSHETMLRLHFMQQWFGLSDLGMEDALFDMALFRNFAGLTHSKRLPDRVSILRFHQRLEKYKLVEKIMATVNATRTQKGLLLNQGTAIDATFIAAPSSTKSQNDERSPEM